MSGYRRLLKIMKFSINSREHAVTHSYKQAPQTQNAQIYSHCAGAIDSGMGMIANMRCYHSL